MVGSQIYLMVFKKFDLKNFRLCETNGSENYEQVITFSKALLTNRNIKNKKCGADKK